MAENVFLPPTGPAQPAGWYAPPPSRGSSAPLVLGIVALVLAGAAFLGMLGVVVFVVTGGGPGGGGDTLTGSVPVSGPVALGGDSLSGAVSSTIDADGEHADRMTCPDTPRVAQGVVTVCHGRIDGDDWAVVVFFENAAGRYTLSPV